MKGALYGSLRRVGSIGKKASRSKSVSNLQALFNPLDDSSIQTTTFSSVAPPAAAPPVVDKENSEVSVKYEPFLSVFFFLSVTNFFISRPSLSASSKVANAPAPEGDCPLSPLSPNSQKKRRPNYGGLFLSFMISLAILTRFEIGVKFGRENEVGSTPTLKREKV